MRFLDQEIEKAVTEGRLFQALVADAEGFVLENLGERFDPELLAASFSPSQGLARRVQDSLGAGRVEELAVRFEDEKMRVVVRYIHHEGEGFMVVAVVPLDRGWRLLTSRIMNRITR